MYPPLNQHNQTTNILMCRCGAAHLTGKCGGTGELVLRLWVQDPHANVTHSGKDHCQQTVDKKDPSVHSNQHN